MAGAAAVAAAMIALAELRPGIAVTAYLLMAENLPGSGAYRPGNMVTRYGAKPPACAIIRRASVGGTCGTSQGSGAIGIM